MLNELIRKIITAVLFTAAVYGQPSEWSFQNPLPDGESGEGITTVGNNIYICGLFGKIIASNDNGKSWSKQEWQTIRNLFTIDFVNEDTGIVAGGSGDIFKTTNKGKNWERKYPPINFLIRDIVYVNDTLIIAGGRQNKILRSADAGEDWSIIPLPVNCVIQSITFVNDTLGFACGADAEGGVIFRTSDSGFKWEKVHSAKTAFMDVCSTNEKTIYIVEEQQVHKSVDAGKTWEMLNLQSFPWYQTFRSISFADEKNGIIAGAYGLLLKTNDAGNTWSVVTSPDVPFLDFSWNNPDFNSVVFANQSTGFIIGSYGVIIKTTDKGITWKQISKGNTPALFAFDFYDKRTGAGAAAGAGGLLLVTTDKGKNWNKKESGSDKYNYFAVNTLSEKHMVLSGLYMNNGDNYEQGVLQVTDDGGNSWKSIYLGQDMKVSSAGFFDEKNGLVAAYTQKNFSFPPGQEDCYGTIFKTTDGGFTWNKIFNIERTEAFYPKRLQILSEKEAIILGEYGLFYKTNDGGNTWAEISRLPQYGNTTALVFVDKNIGYVSNSVVIYKTTDGGHTWVEKLNTGNLGNRVYSLHFIDENNGYAVGEGSTGPNYSLIIKTTDGGETWEYKYPPTVNQLYSVIMLNKEEVFAAGPGGTIISTIKPVVTGVDDAPLLAEEFSLSQNYPNPFNPVTTIKYTVPVTNENKSSHVILKVYDILGNEIAELVNEEKTSGEYAVNFNAAGLASGIYMYRLSAGSFNSTKKMVILK